MRTAVIGVILAACAIFSLPAHGQTKSNIFVATGPTTGVYYPLGGGIADVLTKNIPGLNATAGTTYIVAVDGYGDASGRLDLSWRLTPAQPPVPVITQQPASVTAPARYWAVVSSAPAVPWCSSGTPPVPMVNVAV